jgi:chitinase
MEASKAASADENNPNAGDGAGDAYADYQRTYDAATSVDGVADTWNQPLVGTFNQLRKLKAANPNLKVLLSLGGWTYSKYFSPASASSASRSKLVSSCVDMFMAGNLPSQGGFGGPGSAAGIFDGFDIDWEYPGTNGHTGNIVSAADTANYTLLLQEFRNQLNAFGAANGGRRTYLTAAVPAGQDKIGKIQTGQVGQYLDFANLMSYDMHGGWEAQGPVNHQAQLYSPPGDPMPPVAPGQARYSADEAVTAWTAGDAAYGIAGGFPAGKLTLGIPFYYRGWTGVPAGANHGLYGTATGPAPARPTSQVAGIAYYKELTGLVTDPAKTFYDPVAKAAYFYDGTEFWTGESPQSIRDKADYLHCKGLGGAMMFSLLDLDPADTLFNAATDAVKGSPGSCAGGPPPPTTTTTGPPPPPPTTTTNPPPPPPPTTTTAPGGPAPGGGCPSAWNPTTAYTGGMEVSYGGHKWSAKWWTYGDVPGHNGPDVWVDEGAC